MRVKALAVVLLVAGLGWWLLSLARAPVLAPSLDGPALLSDTGGPIRLAVTSLVSARRSMLPNAGLVQRVVNALPSGARILVLVNDREAFTVARDPWPGRVAFVEMDADTPITIWPQDPFLVLHDPDEGPRLLVSRRFERAGDRAMASAVAEALGWPLQESALDFEGGNVVTDAHTAFLGANTIRWNATRLGERDVEVAARFEAEFGRRVLVVGPWPQPVAHIDMVLTPLGDGRVALADPARGADLAERALRQSPAAVAAFERELAERFFAHPGVEAVRLPGGEILEPPALVGATTRAVAESRRIAPALDRLAEDLAARGYRVVRVPFLFAPFELEDEAMEVPRFRPGYPTLTWNNVLLERAGGRATVYLPRYGFPALDEAAHAVWTRLGFEVRAVEGLARSAMYGGALRCTVKVLGRAPGVETDPVGPL